jgi:hypothetical protein
VDPVHRSTVDRSKGYAPLLIWVVRAHRTAPVACGRRAAGRWPAPAPEQRQLAGDLAGEDVLELGATVWDAAGLYAELGERRTQPGLQGGGSGDV